MSDGSSGNSLQRCEEVYTTELAEPPSIGVTSL
jgi:hypothetical protein